MTKYINTKEAATLLGVNASRVRQLILAGKLAAEKVGRDWVIKPGDLKRVMTMEGRRQKKDATSNGKAKG